MTNDESPVDVAAFNAAPPADAEPLANTGAAPDAAPAESPSPARRRRAPNAGASGPRARRAPRAAKTEVEPPVAEPAPAQPAISFETTAPIVESVTAETPEKPAARRRGGGSRRKPPEAPTPSVDSAAPAGLPVTGEQVEIADIGTIPAVDAADTAPTSGETPAAEKPKRPRRTSRKKPVDEALERPAAEPIADTAVSEPAPETTVEPLAEAPAVAATRNGRTRRGGRSRRKAGELAPETVVETAEAPPAVESRAEAAAAPAAEAPAEDRGRRTRRGERRRVEKPVEAPEDLSRGGRLVTRRGVVELLVRGEVTPPVLFFGSVEGEKEARKVAGEVQRAAGSGVHIHSTLVELTCPLPPDDTVYETFDSRIETLLHADPKGVFIPRIVFVPAAGWRRQYPNEVNHYADGTTDDPSIASSLFWQEAENALTALIEHVSRMGYGGRVIGYHLERGEWFHPADGGYDRSYANREAFRAWLRAKYKNSEASLRAAWFDGTVQFYTAEIPPLPTSTRPELAFFEPRKDRRWIDFLEYTSEVTADRLISLARAVKAASENRALVSVCYGYTFEFGHTFSGHLALGRLLASPAIDIVAGPPSYRDRQPGGAASFPAPADSMLVHGKLWLSEDDTKTYLSPTGESPDDFNPRIDSRWATEQAQKRAMGKSLAHRTAIAWMDTWGEGWLDSEEIWRSIGAFTGRYRDLLSSRKTWSPEVVVLVDEKSLLHVQKGEGFVRRLLRDQRELIQQSGASVGFYLQSDVLSKSFPTDAKLYLFLTPYRLPADQRAAIKEKLQQGGKTLVWMFAPGVCDARGEPEEGAHELVGITLRQQSWNSDVGSRIVENRHPITDGVQNRHVGVRERLNPSFSVDDDSPRLTIVGEYQQSGLPSIAAREMEGWKSVFCGEPVLSAELFRGLCRYAGVHLYTTGGDDFVFAGDGWLTIHTGRDGNRVVQLPPSRDLYSLDDMRLLAQNSSEYRTFMKGRSTYSFYVGTVDEMRKLGLPVERTPARRRGSQPASSAPAPAAEGAQEASELAPLLSPDEAGPESGESTAAYDLLLSEVAVPVDPDGVLPLETPGDIAGEGDEDGEEGAEGEDAVAGESSEAALRRRRRRRGGRGRGRRHRPGGEANGAEAPTAPPPD